MKLVIVESPTKAKTITKFLPKEYTVESSYGHLRDLPKKTMGIDIEGDFEPEYDVMPDKKKQVAKLRKLAKEADEILFATDEDREGEAISWHLAHILKLDPKKVKRIAFHEITKKAILKALENPRKIDLARVDAQQARRVLDRLVGYELSPFLWKKVTRGLSAGRVQSVAVRLIVEREREIRKFKPDEYWTIDGMFVSDGAKDHPLESALFKIDEDKLEKLSIGNEKDAHAIVEACKDKKASIASIEQKEKKRNPNAPFTTSTLQQAAHSKFGWSAKNIMRLAQQLYEGIETPGEEGTTGLITYMRTDSVTLSEDYLTAARDYAKHTFSEKYIPEKPHQYKTKSKSAQEAHEAVRPTHVELTPDRLKDVLNDQQWKLYDLIWRRALASQMNPAQSRLTTILMTIDGSDKKTYTYKTTGSVIVFDGFLAVYPEQLKDRTLPDLKEGEELSVQSITPEQHFTEPPPRYNDASLVKVLEEHGIGRPSTYAPTIGTIEARGYVERLDRRRFSPTDIGEVVNDVLVAHFPKIVDYDFTAHMEEQFDDIADGEKEWKPIIKDFYKPFKDNLEKKTEEVKKEDIVMEKTDKKCSECGKDVIIRVGRYGKFYACSGYPDCKHTEPLEKDKKEKAEPKEIGVACVKCKAPLVERKTRRGKIFYGCSTYPTCDFALWGMPLENQFCEECKSLLMASGKTKVKCSNYKECDFSRKKTEADEKQIATQLARVKKPETDSEEEPE
ncbi:MAG: DNA topoisomerase I [Parcubacteria group bacterium]|nr:DNA topoisomerase I [Parcubacteria group bacterium]